MKKIILLFTLCVQFLTAQEIIFDKKLYEEVAQKQFLELYTNENYPRYSIDLAKKYQLNDLKIVSIPIFGWHQKTYQCGDNIDSLIDIKQDALFQKVLIVLEKKNLRVEEFEIWDSYKKEYRKQDSLLGPPPPVMLDTEKMEKNIHRYILKNPDIFVFMIKDLHGYWAIIDGKIVKLRWRFGIKTIDGRKYVSFYGEEYINDIISYSFRIGYKYRGCRNYYKKSKTQSKIKNVNK